MNESTRPGSDRSQDRGMAILYTVFFLLVMLGFVALGVDVSKLMATRTQLQRAADAAALAGASAIDLTTGTLLPDSATARAQETGALNRAFVNAPTPVAVQAGDVSFPTPQRCRVVVRRDPGAGGSMVTHVAQVLGIKSLSLTATATAEAAPASMVCEGLIPMAPDVALTGEIKVGCAYQYDLKSGAQGGQQGNYHFIEYPECAEGECASVGGGAAAVRCQSEHGYSCCVGIGDEFVITQPGNKVGPFQQAMDGRWAAETDRRENICHREYQGNGERVIRVPIVESFDVSGTKTVRIIKFAAFFMSQRPTSGGQQSLKGEFIYDVAPGESGDPAGGGTIYAIRLVE